MMILVFKFQPVKMRYIQYNGSTYKVPENLPEEEAMIKIIAYETKMYEEKERKQKEEEEKEKEKKIKIKNQINKILPFINEYLQIGSKRKITEKNLLRKECRWYSFVLHFEKEEQIERSIERKKWFNDKNFDMRYIFTIVVKSSYWSLEKSVKNIINLFKNGALENLPYNCLFIEVFFDIDEYFAYRYKFSNKILDELNFYFSGKQYKFI